MKDVILNCQLLDFCGNCWEKRCSIKIYLQAYEQWNPTDAERFNRIFIHHEIGGDSAMAIAGGGRVGLASVHQAVPILARG